MIRFVSNHLLAPSASVCGPPSPVNHGLRPQAPLLTASFLSPGRIEPSRPLMVLSVIPGHPACSGNWPEPGPVCRVGRWACGWAGGRQAGDGSGPGLWPARPHWGVRDLVFKILCTALICFRRKETGERSRGPPPRGHAVGQVTWTPGPPDYSPSGQTGSGLCAHCKVKIIINTVQMVKLPLSLLTSERDPGHSPAWDLGSGGSEWVASSRGLEENCIRHHCQCCCL